MPSRLAAWSRRQRPFVVDGALAVLVAGVQLSILSARLGAPNAPEVAGASMGLAVPLAVVLTLTASLPVAWRRRAPVPVLATVGFSAVGLAALGMGDAGLGLVVALYTVAAYASREESLVSLAIFAAFTAVSLVLADAVAFAAANALVFLTAWVLGDRRRLQRRRTEALERRTAGLREGRAADLRLAVVQERERITGEVHDALAHSVTAMLTQTVAAQRWIDRVPGRAAEALLEVERGGRECLADLRRLLGLLRDTGDGASPGPSRVDVAAAGSRPAPRPGTDVDAAVRPRAPEGEGAVRARRQRGARAVAAARRVLAGWRGLPLRLRDTVFAATVATVELVTLAVADPDVFDWAGYQGFDGSSGLVVLAMYLPLLWRRRFPHAVLAATVVATVASIWMGVPSQLFAPLIALYTVALQRPRRESALWLAGLLPLAVVLLAVAGELALLPNHAVVLGTAWLLGDRQRTRSAYAADLEARAAELESARERDRAIMVAEERGRLARELHDVLAHTLSLMVVTAGAARRTLARDPERAKIAVRQVVDIGRDSLGQLRRLLGLLDADVEGAGSGRAPGGGAAAGSERAPGGVPRGAAALRRGGAVTAPGDDPLAPQPRLADLDELVGSFRAAGLTVALDVRGRRRPLPATVELSAYRIVQESLTNILKHAGRARASVLLDYSGDCLAVQVDDDGRGPAPGDAELVTAAGAPARGGHGVVGMRERAALVGGTLAVGGRPGGGFRVRAALPWKEEA